MEQSTHTSYFLSVRHMALNYLAGSCVEELPLTKPMSCKSTTIELTMSHSHFAINTAHL